MAAAPLVFPAEADQTTAAVPPTATATAAPCRLSAAGICGCGGRRTRNAPGILLLCRLCSTRSSRK